MSELLLAKENRRQQASYISKLFLWWVFPTIKEAQNKTLEADMIPDLTEDEQSEAIHKDFQKIFRNLPESPNMLSKALFLHNKSECVFLIFILTVGLVAQMMVPVLIKWIIEYISDDDRNIADGVYLVIGVFISRILGTLTNAHTYNTAQQIGYKTMTCLSMEILHKSLKVSFLSNKNYATGDVLTLIQVDAAKLQVAAYYLAGVGFLPLWIIVGLYLMFDFIGVSFLAGFGVMLITMFVNVIIGKYLMVSMITAMGAKSKRTTFATEMFQQIKFIKINAFEEYFNKKLQELRNAECNSIKKQLLLNACNILSVWISPPLIMNATFGLFIGIGGQLTPSNTFALVSIFQILQVPLYALPMSVNALLQTNVSIKRLQTFLLTKELQNDCIQSDLSDVAISVSGTFQWGVDKDKKDKPDANSQAQVADIQAPAVDIIKDIDITVNKGKFVALIGDVGSGKSSFLQAIIGEMIYEKKPLITVNGSIAYVSQSAWIQNATVKDNILFGRNFNEARYNQAIKYCCLSDDLKILSKGDQTMIGEKGVNLSGGQKARVSLARALYADADIYLLDDPISAVDVHVGKFIMQECLNGFLKSKTRILVTHAVNFTQYCDQIYLLDNGQVAEQGTFNELKTSPKFEVIYKKFFKEAEEHPAEIKEEAPKLVKKESTTTTLVAQKDEIDDLILLETKAQGSISAGTYLKYIKYNGIWSFTLVMIMMIMWLGCYMGSSLWLASWATKSGEDENLNNTFYLEIYLLLGIGQGVIAFLRTWYLSWTGVKAANEIHRRMMNALSYAPLCQFFERVPVGQILNRLTKDQNTLDVEMLPIISWVMISAAQLLGNTALMVYSSSYYVILFIILYFVICYYLQKYYIKASRELYRLEAISRSPIISYFTEAIGGLSTIRAFGRQQQFIEKHGQNQDFNRKLSLEQITTSTWFSLVLSLNSFIVQISAIVFCMFYGTKHPGLAGIILTYASSLDQNVSYTVQAASMVENQMVAFERCEAYTHTKSEPAYNGRVQALQNNDPFEEQKVANWPQSGLIEYNQYSVRYRDGLPLVLKQLNFTITEGQKIGVVGRTGAGKSTITMTLLRILEAAEGQLIIDGVPISKVPLRQLRESITMIMQDANIFNGSIRDNVDPMHLYGDDQILRTLEQCCLSELIANRTLDAPLTGTNLSAGEKQLMCIARAVLRKSKIVLIDEATANIDIETESKIQSTIQREFASCTVITIAHRINTILHCDKILVIDQGQLKEFGNTNDLLNDRNSLFFAIQQETQKH